MSMLLVSEKLLQEELNKKPENPNDQQDFYYSMVEKELYLVKRLNIELCNMRGEVKEVADRLEHNEILICPQGELEHMRECMSFKDHIMDVVRMYYPTEF